jgi:DNA-binding transcriptional LysR family regulator
MNIKHAQYMLTVIQEGSITAAAKKLYISQPSLSQMIKLVETNLGTPIFNRATDPISLTYAGEKYIEAARQILLINTNLQKEITEITNEDQGVLRLGIPVQRAMQVIPYILPKFRSLYPLVKMKIYEQGSNDTEERLLEGTIDLACLTTYPKYEELSYHLVEQEDLVLLTSRNSAIAKRIPAGTPIDITEAKDEYFISIKPGHSVRTIQDRLFIQKDIQPKILLESVSIEVAKRTAVACDAVMIIPFNYVDITPELYSSAVTYPLKNIEYNRSFYICHRKDRYMTKYMKDFITMLTIEDAPFMNIRTAKL